jgi:spore germination cell wall hydrolase CwlJ-like protein
MNKFDLFVERLFRGVAIFALLSISIAFSGINPISFYVGFSNQEIPEPKIIIQPDDTEVAPEEIQYVWEDDEIICLQKNIYFEARNQSKEAMEAVALVTMNRVASRFYPDTICEVVYEGRKSDGRVVRNQCQFSWTCDGKADEPKLKNKDEIMAWNIAYDIALDVSNGKVDNFLGQGVTHYHANYVKPHWAKVRTRYVRTAQIEKHIFYKDKKETI